MAMAASGELQALLDRYGIPYFPPFKTAQAETRGSR